MPEGGGGGSATGNPILDLAIVIVLIVVSGFFAASELSLITAKRHRLSQLASEGNRSAQVAERLMEDPSRFLATIQVALTFLGFLASAVGAVSFSGAVAEVDTADPAAVRARCSLDHRIPADHAAHRAGVDHRGGARAQDARP